MSIVPPANAVANIPFNVTVNLTGGPGGATVTLSGCGATSNTVTAAPGAYSVTIPMTIPLANIPPTGTCTLTATANLGYGTATFAGFKVFVGQLGCNSTNRTAGNLDATADIAFVGTPDWGLVRGPNYDNNTCIVVPYTFNFYPATNTASFIADKTGISPDQKISVEYVLLWNAVPVGTTGFSTLAPWVSWGIDNPVWGTDDYVPGLPCFGSDLDVLAYPANASIMPVIPNVAPFSSFAPGHQYSPWKSGTSTDDPPDNYAKMCVAQHARTAIGGGLIQYWTKIIDQSDGYVGIE